MPPALHKGPTPPGLLEHLRQQSPGLSRPITHTRKAAARPLTAAKSIATTSRSTSADIPRAVPKGVPHVRACAADDVAEELDPQAALLHRMLGHQPPRAPDHAPELLTVHLTTILYYGMRSRVL